MNGHDPPMPHLRRDSAHPSRICARTADVAGVPKVASPVAAQMWEGRAQSQYKCGRGEPDRATSPHSIAVSPGVGVGSLDYLARAACAYP